MYEVSKINDQRIDLTFSGRLTAADMQSMLDELLPLAESCQHAALICRLKEFNFPTMGAIAVELSHLPKLLKLLHKFDRCAVLADENWVKIGATIESWLIPGMKLKAFEHASEDEAIKWAQGGS